MIHCVVSSNLLNFVRHCNMRTGIIYSIRFTKGFHFNAYKLHGKTTQHWNTIFLQLDLRFYCFFFFFFLLVCFIELFFSLLILVCLWPCFEDTILLEVIIIIWTTVSLLFLLGNNFTQRVKIGLSNTFILRDNITLQTLLKYTLTF